MTDATSFAEPEVQRCPYELIARLQRDQPVYRDPLTGFFVITRHADILAAAQNPQLFSSTTTIILDRKDSPVAGEVARRYAEHGFLPMHTLVTADPPAHTRYRGLIDKIFTASFVAKLEPSVVALANELIDDFPQRGRIDLLRDFCVKLPMYMIAGQLGVPREDWERFKLWSDVSNESINPQLAPERELEITDLIIEMQLYLHRRMQEYRDRPADTLLSQLANLQVEGDPLSPRELVSVAHHLLVAGNETTTTTLSSGLFMLLQDQSLQSQLRENPGKIPAFVEETLRLHPPVKYLYRQATADTEVSGTLIPKNSVVTLSTLGANRDPCTFASPETVELERRNARQHLAFGRGIHFCIGNQLARAELRIAIECLLGRLPKLQLDSELPIPTYATRFHTHEISDLYISR